MKRAAEEEDDEKDRPGKKRGRLESRGLGPQPPSSHLGSLGGVASARTRQIVEEKLIEYEEQENSELVSLGAGAEFLHLGFMEDRLID